MRPRGGPLRRSPRSGHPWVNRWGRLQRGNGPRLRLLGLVSRDGRLRARRRPFELELELELVAVDFHLELAAHLVRDAEAHRGLAKLQVDLAVLSERPRQRRQFVGRLLPRQRLLEFHLHVRHGPLPFLLAPAWPPPLWSAPPPVVIVPCRAEQRFLTVGGSFGSRRESVKRCVLPALDRRTYRDGRWGAPGMVTTHTGTLYKP